MDQLDSFFSLTPDRLLGEIETALGSSSSGIRATGRTMTLNSMENRVYDVEMDDGAHWIAKFYRPGRWSREAILDEHTFIRELAEDEISAVVPRMLSTGSSLACSAEGIFFALFPKVRGRIIHELSDEQLAIAGRLLARLHNVGARAKAPHRLALTTKTYGRDPLAAIRASKHLLPEYASAYASLVEQILARIEPLFAGVATHRIHGDCHLGNVLWTGGVNESVTTYFVDFDDMCTGPAVQDLWMIVRGRDEEAERQRGILLEHYERLRAFDRTTLRLIEPLRALRMIHYCGWIARRYADPIFQQMFPEFGTTKYWAEECRDLREQLEWIEQAVSPSMRGF